MPLMQTLRATVAGLLVAVFAGAAEPPAFSIESLQPGGRSDGIKVDFQGDAVVFAIRDGRGIGGARITPKGGDWPKSVVLRFHLGGLEQLVVSGAKVTLFASVLSHSGHARVLEIGEAGQRKRAAGKDDPLQMNIHIRNVKGEEMHALPDPAKGGYFEAVVPSALLAGEKASLTLQWIDFFR